LDRRLGGPQIQSGHCGEEKNLLPCWESKSDSSVIQPIVQLLYQLSKPRHFNKIQTSVLKVSISYTLCASCFSFPVLEVYALQTAANIAGIWFMFLRAFSQYISFLLNNDDKVPDTSDD
jgi:hypothetical protein